jgi:exosortase E/protease (VPEID-CTERM system)
LSIFPTSNFFDKPATRWLFFFTILAIEVIAITSSFEVPSPQYYFVAKPDSAWLFDFTKQYWKLMVWIISNCLLMLMPHYQLISHEFDQHLQRHRGWVWFAFHLLILVAFIFITSFVFKQPADPARLTVAWFSVWFIFASATFTFWLLALAPVNFWLWLISKNSISLVVGCTLGVLAWLLIDMLFRQEAPLAQKELWSYFSGLTLQIVHYLLGLIYSDLVYEPLASVVGTKTFPVEVTYACSGIEGVSLIIVFLCLYLWLFRKNLRFPQVFWLLPAGIAAIWLANAVRITLLVVVGSSISPEIAGMGFHAQAGWIAFTLISVSAIALTHQMKFFSARNQSTHEIAAPQNNIATPLITPFLVQMAALMLTSAFSSNFDWLYPVRIGAVAAVLYYYRNSYIQLFSKWNWQSPALGVLVFIIWMLLEPQNQENGQVLSQNLEKLSSEWAALWLIFRVLGSIVIIPIAEELVFRGYLIRKLIDRDFENVAPNQFTWISFILSSLLFGLMHDRWLAGTLAGMGFAIALYRRGKLGDAVIAHMTTNALIAVLVLTQGRWSLWA